MSAGTVITKYDPGLLAVSKFDNRENRRDMLQNIIQHEDVCLPLVIVQILSVYLLTNVICGNRFLPNEWPLQGINSLSITLAS